MANENLNELYDALRNADAAKKEAMAAGDTAAVTKHTEAARRLSEYIQTLPTEGEEKPSGPPSTATPSERLEFLQPTVPPSEPTLPEGNVVTGATGTAIGMGQGLGASLLGNLYGLAKRIGGASPREAEEAAAELISRWARQPSTEKEKTYTEAIGKTLGALPPNLADIVPAPLVGAAKAQVVSKLEDLGTKVKTPLVLTPEQTLKNEVAKQSIDAGYAIPPSQAVKPTLGGRLSEAASGKIQTAQKFSEHNQANTIRLVKQDIGVPQDVAITPEVLDSVRGRAGTAYEALKNVPTNFQVTPRFKRAADAIAKRLFEGKDELPGLFTNESPAIQGLMETLQKKEFSPQASVIAIKRLREESKLNLKAIGDSEKNQLGYAQKAAADAMEQMVEQNLSSSTKRMEIFRNLRKQGITGVDPLELLKNFRAARKTIAKAYSVEDALGPNGAIYAEKLGKQLGKGKPLSGNLKKAADFARTYPKVNQSVEKIGSQPGWSPLDIYASITGAGSGAAIGHSIAGPVGAAVGTALGATAPIVRPAIRSRMMQPGALSRIPVQDVLLPSMRSRAVGGLKQAIEPLPYPGYAPALRGPTLRAVPPYREPMLIQAEGED